MVGHLVYSVLLVRCFTTIYQGNGPSGEELISKVPLYKQKWRVSEADIHKISELLGQGWWEMFAVKIGFQREVEDIKRSYHNSLDNQKYQLLLQWSCRHESKATYRIILKVLSRLDKINTLDNVCKLLHAQSERAVLSRVLAACADFAFMYRHPRSICKYVLYQCHPLEHWFWSLTQAHM